MKNLKTFTELNEAKEVKPLPEDTQKEVEAGRVTYRGLGFGKEGVKIKVKGKEYVITDDKFKELGGIQKIKFAAPFRKE